MEKEVLDRAIQIKKEIEELEAEINLLPMKGYGRTLREIIGGILKRNHNNLYVVETHTYNKEVIKLNEEDMYCLVELREERLERLKKELAKL